MDLAVLYTTPHLTLVSYVAGNCQTLHYVPHLTLVFYVAGDDDRLPDLDCEGLRPRQEVRRLLVNVLRVLRLCDGVSVAPSWRAGKEY